MHPAEILLVACIFHLTEGYLNANAVVGDWKCVCLILGWSLETVTECSWPAQPQGEERIFARACMKQHCINFSGFYLWRNISGALLGNAILCLQPLFSSVQPYVPGNYVIMKKKALFDHLKIIYFLKAIYILQCDLCYTNLQLDPNPNSSQQKTFNKILSNVRM